MTTRPNTADKKPRARGVSRAEFEALEERVAAMEKAAMETHDKVGDLHKALMEPTPGQTKSLIDRMATVTINVESGGRVASVLIKIAATLAALGVIWAWIASGGSGN